MGHPAETSDPTPRAVQAKAVDALASDANVAKAADAAGVDRETLRDRLDGDLEFIASLNRAKLERSDRLRAEVRDLASEAVATLRGLLSNPKVHSTIRLRAALGILGAANAMRSETIGPTSEGEIRAELTRRDLFASLGM